MVIRQSQIVRSDSQIALQTRRKYRQSSPCKHDAIDNALQSYSAMMNETLIAQSENSQLFRRQSSPFLHSKTTNPLKTERANSKEKIYTPNSIFFRV